MLRHLFLHVHKSGGTSVVENLWKPLVRADERHLEDDLLPGGVHHGRPHTYTEMYRVAQNHGLAYADVFRAFWGAGRLPTHARLYSGHMAFGAHEAMPEPFRYSTVIRHPVERTVSHFHLVKSVGAFGGSFADYVECGGVEVTNYQVKLLTRRGFRHYPALGDGDLDEAVHNLSTLFDFCVTEHLDDFVDGLIAFYRFPVENRRLIANRTAEAAEVKGSPGVPHRRFEVDEKLLSRLAEQNRLDMGLYEWARERSAARWLVPPARRGV